MDESKVEAQRIIDDMTKKRDLRKVEEMLKDNKIEFSYKDKEYRVRLLNLREKEELDFLRVKEFGRLLQEKDILLECNLIKQYKENGIDISEIDESISKFQSELKDLCMKLGEAIAKKVEDSILKSYEERINITEREINVLASQKVILLQYSKENRLLGFVYKCLTYLSLEEKVNDEWKRTFNNMDDLFNCDEELVNQAGQYTAILQNV